MQSFVINAAKNCWLSSNFTASTWWLMNILYLIIFIETNLLYMPRSSIWWPKTIVLKRNYNFFDILATICWPIGTLQHIWTIFYIIVLYRIGNNIINIDCSVQIHNKLWQKDDKLYSVNSIKRSPYSKWIMYLPLHSRVLVSSAV